MVQPEFRKGSEVASLFPLARQYLDLDLHVLSES